MSVQLTKEQAAVVASRGGQLLVSAAAGSGKTFVLVQRLLDRVIREGIDLDQFLIITFTKAAAAELRSKDYGGASEGPPGAAWGRPSQAADHVDLPHPDLHHSRLLHPAAPGEQRAAGSGPGFPHGGGQRGGAAAESDPGPGAGGGLRQPGSGALCQLGGHPVRWPG